MIYIFLYGILISIIIEEGVNCISSAHFAFFILPNNLAPLPLMKCLTASENKDWNQAVRHVFYFVGGRGGGQFFNSVHFENTYGAFIRDMGEKSTFLTS